MKEPIKLCDLKEGDTFKRFGFTPSLPWHKQLDMGTYVRGHRVSLGRDVIVCIDAEDRNRCASYEPTMLVYEVS